MIGIKERQLELSKIISYSQRGVGLLVGPRFHNDESADELRTVGDVNERRQHQSVEMRPDKGTQGSACCGRRGGHKRNTSPEDFYYYYVMKEL